MTKTIFINAGHGGTDSGAVSKNGNKEADIAKKVCDILCKRLQLNWYPFIFYQQKKNYFEISRKENDSKSCVFISVHCNSATKPEAHGIEVLYKTSRGKEFAKITLDELVKATGLTSRGVKYRENLHVLNRTKAPAILIELAFLSNPIEEKLLIEKPEIFANAIWEAIKKFKEKNLISI